MNKLIQAADINLWEDFTVCVGIVKTCLENEIRRKEFQEENNVETKF